MPHAAYKDHRLWLQAMGVVHQAYALAARARSEAPLVARHIRRAAVAVPANLAEALLPEGGRPRTESVAMARGALAEIERQTLLLPEAFAAEGDTLARQARKLYHEISRASELVEEPSA
jgi:four helix bundle protein